MTEIIDVAGVEVEVASKEEKYWIDLKEKFEKNKESLEQQLKFNDAVLEMCSEKIKKKEIV